MSEENQPSNQPKKDNNNRRVLSDTLLILGTVFGFIILVMMAYSMFFQKKGAVAVVQAPAVD